MNYEEKFKVNDEVETTLVGHAFGIVLEVGEETILIQWDDLKTPTEHEMDEFDSIYHKKYDDEEIINDETDSFPHKQKI